MLNVFKGKPKYMTVKPEIGKQKEFPENLWTRCDGCGKVIYNKELDKSGYLCPECGYHFRVGSAQRLAMLVDKGSFVPFSSSGFQSLDFLDMKIKSLRPREDWAGRCRLGGKKRP